LNVLQPLWFLKTESARPYQSGHGDDQMNEQNEKIAHLGNGISNSRTTAFRPIWQFAMDMLLNHLEGILNYCRTKVRFGVVEALNGNIRILINRGRGYKERPLPEG
jgi:transposase